MDMVSVTVSVRWLLRGPCRRALFAGHNGSLRNEARLISQGTVTLGRGGRMLEETLQWYSFLHC